jgi:CheY-like chemotaxis protein
MDKKNPPSRVLHLEENPRNARLIEGFLQAEGAAYEIVLISDWRQFEEALEGHKFDVILCNSHPDFDGLRPRGLYAV